MSDVYQYRRDLVTATELSDSFPAPALVKVLYNREYFTGMRRVDAAGLDGRSVGPFAF